jgi:hypothetical protein
MKAKVRNDEYQNITTIESFGPDDSIVQKESFVHT